MPLVDQRHLTSIFLVHTSTTVRIFAMTCKVKQLLYSSVKWQSQGQVFVSVLVQCVPYHLPSIHYIYGHQILPGHYKLFRLNRARTHFQVSNNKYEWNVTTYTILPLVAMVVNFNQPEWVLMGLVIPELLRQHLMNTESACKILVLHACHVHITIVFSSECIYVHKFSLTQNSVMWSALRSRAEQAWSCGKEKYLLAVNTYSVTI